MLNNLKPEWYAPTFEYIKQLEEAIPQDEEQE